MPLFDKIIGFKCIAPNDLDMLTKLTFWKSFWIRSRITEQRDEDRSLEHVELNKSSTTVEVECIRGIQNRGNPPLLT
jgi:hypothetical protein